MSAMERQPWHHREQAGLGIPARIPRIRREKVLIFVAAASFAACFLPKKHKIMGITVTRKFWFQVMLNALGLLYSGALKTKAHLFLVCFGASTINMALANGTTKVYGVEVPNALFAFPFFILSAVLIAKMDHDERYPHRIEWAD